MGWVVNATPRPLYPRERPGTHCIEGWVSPRARLDRCGKSRPHQDLIPGPSRLQRVAIPTELSRHILKAKEFTKERLIIRQLLVRKQLVVNRRIARGSYQGFLYFQYHTVSMCKRIGKFICVYVIKCGLSCTDYHATQKY